MPGTTVLTHPVPTSLIDAILYAVIVPPAGVSGTCRVAGSTDVFGIVTSCSVCPAPENVMPNSLLLPNPLIFDTVRLRLSPSHTSPLPESDAVGRGFTVILTGRVALGQFGAVAHCL